MFWTVVVVLVYMATFAYMVKTIIVTQESRREYHMAMAELNATMEVAMADLDAQLINIDTTITNYLKEIRAAEETSQDGN